MSVHSTDMAASGRRRLPDRRPNETVDVTVEGSRYAVTIGYHPGGRVGDQ